MSAPENWPVFAGGEFHSADTPVLLVGDFGFTLGLSVFDSLVFEEGVCLFLEEHLARLEHGARGVGIPWPPPWDPREVLYELARRIGADPLVLRTTLSRGSPGRGTTMVVAARPVTPPPSEGVHLWIPDGRIEAEPAIDGLKSTNRLRNVLAREEANARGAFDALFVDGGGRLIEGTISNVFVRFGAELRTPALGSGCLAGITRGLVFETLASDPLVLPDSGRLLLTEHATRLAELGDADEIFVTNSSGRATGAISVRGSDLEVTGLPGAEGPAVKAIEGRIRRIEADYRARTSDRSSP